jgi:hypothetical protein
MSGRKKTVQLNPWPTNPLTSHEDKLSADCVKKKDTTPQCNFFTLTNILLNTFYVWSRIHHQSTTKKSRKLSIRSRGSITVLPPTRIDNETREDGNWQADQSSGRQGRSVTAISRRQDQIGSGRTGQVLSSGASQHRGTQIQHGRNQLSHTHIANEIKKQKPIALSQKKILWCIKGIRSRTDWDGREKNQNLRRTIPATQASVFKSKGFTRQHCQKVHRASAPLRQSERNHEHAPPAA